MFLLNSPLIHEGPTLELADVAKKKLVVRAPSTAFRLPREPKRTPIICIAAGTGIAPFHTFAQERAAMIAAGHKDLAPALLFFGCRNPEVDNLYRDELDEWERVGAMTVRRA
ncbi:hypothetical protein B0J13DRAFT_494237 [Dactylonectria estremocensis]|uniref:Oxidoreductase FAD/NAD(P)-binding domain-containing protein n=1 Tax=Dactylonectria estremocensis TaxID=1079267 RepID=A0A9P9JCQ0_9HYPO|nr:hypothetical protein B0J13DRAFT_494237 [Dactylonectria estremocensis]